jgi:hypothetical protein
MAGKQKKAGDQGQAEVQARMDEAHAQGYEGFAPDKTPNAAYTVAGVTKDLDPNTPVARPVRVEDEREADQA